MRFTSPPHKLIYKTVRNFPGPNDLYPTLGLLRDQGGNLYGAIKWGLGFDYGYIYRIAASGQGNILWYEPGFSDIHGTNGDLIHDNAGNLYGTSQGGGAFGSGTVFSLNLATRTDKVLYSFSGGADGNFPYAGVVRDLSGNLYGTTWWGGDLTCQSGVGCGTVFKLDASGTKTTLHSFNSIDGPVATEAGLVMDREGNLYGGCAYGIFKVDVLGNFTMLYRFAGQPDGWGPRGPLIIDASHNLYGVTQFGGAFSSGTVYKFNLDTGQETVLHSLDGGKEGALPTGGVAQDPSGNLFGTATLGGTGMGTVFKVDAAGALTVLHSFASTEGHTPQSKLTLDSAGNIYGATLNATSKGVVVFELSPN